MKFKLNFMLILNTLNVVISPSLPQTHPNLPNGHPILTFPKGNPA